jgi:Zn-dependent protease with chaperone function
VHLYFFLVIIISLSCGSLPPGDIDPLLATAATVAMVAAWIVLCHVGARLCANQVLREKIDPVVGADVLDKQLAAFRWLGLAVVILCLAGFGLARVLDSVGLLGESLFLRSIILIAPGMAITVGTWSAEHHFGVMLGYTEKGLLNLISSIWQLFRGGVAWLIVPVFILLGMSDLISLLPLSEGSARLLSVVVIAMFVVLVLPWLIRHLFKTSSLDEPTEDWIRQLLAAAGLRSMRAVRWETGGRAFNAMVAGFVPPLRTLLISDRLLDELPREQIAMVVLHEAAHVRRRHVPTRMLAILPAWGTGILMTSMIGDLPWASAAGSVVGVLLTVLILRIVAYRTEYDADVQACRMAVKIAGQVEFVPSTYEQAADTMSAALMRVTFDQPGGRKPTWLHPGVADRVDWMRRQRQTPDSNSATAGTIANPA